MRSYLQSLFLSILGVLVVGFSIPGAASESSLGMSRRTFLQGLGSVAAAPIMPSIPVFPAPLITEMLSEPLQGLVTEEFAASIANSASYGLGSWAASTREMQRQIREFLEKDEVEQIRFDHRGEDVYEWAYAHQMISRNYPSREESDAGSETYTQGLIRIVEDISRDRRFSAEFLRSEALLQIRILEGQLSGIFEEHVRINGKQQDPLVDEFRKLFLQKLKDQHPEAYHGYVRNWGLARSLRQDDYSSLMTKTAHRLGFSEVDLVRYSRNLNLPGQSKPQQDANTNHEANQPESIEPNPSEEISADEELQLARSRILSLIQLRAQESCEEVLESPDHPSDSTSLESEAL